ncbi:MAG: bifunctional proline dehydrogenase/L-glutamate gamma-semialdehyde dehydrogenase, partial [Planctomycetota bacterium]
MIRVTEPLADVPRDASLSQRVIGLAGELLTEAQQQQTSAERRQQAELNRLIQHDDDKATLIEMTDQAFRTHTPARVADQLSHVLDVQGIPQFFNVVQRTMLRGFQAFGQYLPGVAVPLVKEKMRQETANVILPAEKSWLATHLDQRQSHDVTMNVNLLGEALLGEDETGERLRTHLDLLRMPSVRCLSVKLTTLYSQVSPLARRHTIRVIADRLEVLIRNAMHPARNQEPKFVYLDMEEYRDLALTADVLRKTLSRDGLHLARAGIALQAYVPDSFGVMKDLIEYSANRVEAGGYPLTIRLVKGANMEMERVHASLAGWPIPTYECKADTDANFKAMLRELIDAASIGHIRVGIASHNLFDVALAMIWVHDASEQHPEINHAVQFEMLEGMANHQRRAITQRGQPMWLYAPACHQADFIHAIGYLVRRLDENTGEQNFLRHSHSLQVNAPEFDRLASDFSRSLDQMDSVSHRPRDNQDRRQTPPVPEVGDHWSSFVNEPDTNWSLPHNTHWIESCLDQMRLRIESGPELIRSVTSDAVVPETTTTITSKDKSRSGLVTARVDLTSIQTVNAVVDAATKSAWGKTDVANRHDILRRVAQRLRQRRGDLIAGMVADAAKAVAQADPEVSEAIDFCEFYPLTMNHWHQQGTIRSIPRGVTAVITPWNFPLAIAAGGIAAALSAGNPVILKPSLETPLPAWQLCQAFWDAGVSRDTLQLVFCDDSVAQAGLVENQNVATVVLTGGTATAKAMLGARPDLHLLAETGGKNATIVTAMADRDLAIKHVLDSAFGHSGQKCSATSLLLLQAEVFDDPEFARMLADATQSLHVGSSWELHNVVTPLVNAPGATLTRGLKELEPDESWLVMPEPVVPEHVAVSDGDTPSTLYRPGIKWNVSRDSFTSCTELFGPVLGVMRFTRLEEAIEIVRSTGYGLTSGLESLDDREIALWKESLPAGNLYINRGTTGAIVLRQPFGGVGLSAYGPGVKAGGPHYVLALSHITDGDIPPANAITDESNQHPLMSWLSNQFDAPEFGQLDRSRIQSAMALQAVAVKDEFTLEHDTFRLVGQDNVRRYRPVEGMVLRVMNNVDLNDLVITLSASIAV